MSPLTCSVLLVLASLLAPAAAQKKFSGSCPTPATITNFDATTFSSTPWYEQRRYYSWLEHGTRCVQWNYALAAAQLTTATTTMTDAFGRVKTMVATLTADVAASSDYSYVITDLPGPAGALAGTYDYQILAFDQTNGYAIAWSCKTSWFFGFTNEQLLWVLTTAQVPTAAVTTAATTAITALGLNTAKLSTTSQTSC